MRPLTDPMASNPSLKIFEWDSEFKPTGAAERELSLVEERSPFPFFPSLLFSFSSFGLHEQHLTLSRSFK
jgi:hypothetical protein